MKSALVTGFTGQDGAFLTDFLLKKGYQVIGLVRRVSTEPPVRSRGLFDFNEHINSGQLVLEEGDLLSPGSLSRVVRYWKPDEIYNLAAQSHVGVSFTQPEFTNQVNYVGLVNLITALENDMAGHLWKLYQASTSEMFGNLQLQTSIDELTSLHPNSPYAIAKTAAQHYCEMKRKEGQWIACGILFNHESEIRGNDFVTQKIAREVVHREMHPGVVLELGNLDAKRDWGYAGDYVEAMWLMLQQNQPEDFVIGTGEEHSVREFVEAALDRRGHDIHWKGKGEKEVGTVYGKPFVKINPKFYRPVDVNFLKANASRARTMLEWTPSTDFEHLVAKMVDHQAKEMGLEK